MKKITTIIFDFDGVIADTLPFTFKKILEIAKFLKVSNLSEKQIIKEIRSKNLKELLNSGMNLSWFKLPFVLRMVKKMQVELGKEIEKIRIFPGMKKLLQDLKDKDYRLIILSSNIKENIDKFVEINKINFFDFIHGKSNVLSKAGELEELIKTFKLNRKKIIYIGDEIRDVEACKKAGIKIIAVSWGLHKKEVLKSHGADFIAKKPKDILKLIYETRNSF
ncbi:MAG: HAD-IA family hydrolase [Candidatus Roizmanbacteria bacterium]